MTREILIRFRYEESPQNTAVVEYQDDDGNNIPLPTDLMAEQLLEGIKAEMDLDRCNGYDLKGVTVLGYEIR